MMKVLPVSYSKPLMISPVPLKIRLVLIRGVIRRFSLNLFHKKYVRESISKRKGQCLRCGVCCHLIANKCWALKYEKEGSRCILYRFYRLSNCCTFPIDQRDLADRNLISPDTPCGFYWDETN